MRRFSIFAFFVFLLAVGGLFALGPAGTQKLQTSFLGFIAPFLKTGSNLERKVSGFLKGVKTLQELEAENKTLSVSNKELRAANQTLRDLEEENNRLRMALQYRERAVLRLVPARVIARDTSSWWNTIKIDRGSADGLKVDQPVLTESGLVGKTIVVAEHAATVLLISDENCKVSAFVEGSPERGIVSGERASSMSQPELCMIMLSRDANLQPGQKVYSSGVGGVYPAGIFIGAIKEFRVRELDGYATLLPAVDLTTLEDVFVVLGNK